MQTFFVARSLPFALAIMLLFLLSGCATTMATGATNKAVCDVWRPIGWSIKDTDQTIVEVKINNARRDGWCKAVK